MEMLKITINGQQITAPTGSTILQAAKQVGIDIPTLCNFPALIPIGACRICLVEVKGQRNLQPACTFPIAAGMEVETETPQLVKARKFILDMLFSERNHYCPFCESSGNCELQSLGYRYGVNHWVYETYTKPFPIDATHQYLIMEHNRCVLCWRCIRACDEVAANHTLGLRHRGASTMINCDSNAPWGESTCISCGTCAQVCPTGAIIDRRSSFMGRDKQMDHVVSTCSQCSIGCGMKIAVRGGNVVRIESDWDAAVNGGLLCQHGRFAPLYDERKRITAPLIRRNGKLVETGWDDALQIVAERIGSIKAKELGVLTANSATNEALYSANKLFRQELKSANMDLLGKRLPKMFEGRGGSLADIAESDIILVVGADPAKDQPVAAYLVKRAIDKGARLIVLDGDDNGLAPFAYLVIAPADINKAVDVALRAERPVVLYGAGVTDQDAKALKKLEKKAAFCALEPGVNTRAAITLGFNTASKPLDAKVLYIMLGEQHWADADLLKKVGEYPFIVVQTAFESPITEQANVVLPSAIWSERSGSLTNTEGRIQKAVKAIDPAGEAKPDWEILSLLAEKMGKKPGSFDDVSARAIKELMGKENE